jgi:hypothetical protein
MTKRECPLLVLSPQGRSEDQVREYKPFGGRPLIAILRDIAAGVSLRKSRRYDKHAVFAGFFFDKLTLAEPLLHMLRDVPSSLVDCEMYRSHEAEAVDTAQKALLHVTSDVPASGKIGRGRMHSRVPDRRCIRARAAKSDEALFAHFWMDLCGSVFIRIGRDGEAVG